MINETKHEPIFNNVPLGTFVLLGIMGLVHLIRTLLQSDEMLEWTTRNAVSSLSVIQLFISDNSNKIQTLKSLIVHQFLHSGIFHLIMNGAMLLQVGPILEISFNRSSNLLDFAQSSDKKGRLKAAILLIVFFLICGVGGAFGMALFNSHENVRIIGASGAISGVYGGYLWAILTMTPKGRPILGQIAISALIFLVINVGLAAAARASNVIPIAWEAHLFGFLTGVILFPIFYRFLR